MKVFHVLRHKFRSQYGYSRLLPTHLLLLNLFICLKLQLLMKNQWTFSSSCSQQGEHFWWIGSMGSAHFQTQQEISRLTHWSLCVICHRAPSGQENIWKMMHWEEHYMIRILLQTGQANWRWVVDQKIGQKLLVLSIYFSCKIQSLFLYHLVELYLVVFAFKMGLNTEGLSSFFSFSFGYLFLFSSSFCFVSFVLCNLDRGRFIVDLCFCFYCMFFRFKCLRLFLFEHQYNHC